MGFLKYYYNRYEKNKAVLCKLIIAACTIILCLVIFPYYNRQYYAGGCAKDAIFTLMGRFVFPFVALISSVMFFILSIKDNNANIILRYGTKKKIWTYQSMAGLVFGMESVVIIYISALLTGYLFFGVYDIWQVEGSYFYMTVTKHKYPVELGISDTEIFVLLFLIKTAILSIINNIALLLEYITNESRLAILAVVVLCGLDYLAYDGVISIFDIHLSDFYNVTYCIEKICAALFSTIVLFLIGLYICRFRQYYKKVE